MELYSREESKTRRLSKVIQDLKDRFASWVKKQKQNTKLLGRLKELNVWNIVKITYKVK